MSLIGQDCSKLTVVGAIIEDQEDVNKTMRGWVAHGKSLRIPVKVNSNIEYALL